jgi:hypothetical protein
MAFAFIEHQGRPEQTATGVAAVLISAACHGLGVAIVFRTLEGWSRWRAAAVGAGCAGLAIAVCYLVAFVAPALGALSFGFSGGDDDDNDSSGGSGGGSDVTFGRSQPARRDAGLCPSCGRASGGDLCPLCRA